jgi:translocation and assembly module TamA
MAGMNPGQWKYTLLLALACSSAVADELTIKVKGLKEPLLTQVTDSIDTYAFSGATRLSSRRLQQTATSAKRKAVEALRPYGYYHAEVESSVTQGNAANSNPAQNGPGKAGGQSWTLTLEVKPGPPVIITAATIELSGDGASEKSLRRWKKRWPLKAGKVLDQSAWEKEKQSALDIAEYHGYLSAQFTRHTIEVDLEQNVATIALVLDTGPQAVMGSITFQQDVVRPGVLELIPRFDEGQPYDNWLLEKFRLDLWRTGYFKDIEIVEERRLEEDPPRVNFIVTADRRQPNTYQFSMGYGTDTDVRVQALWSRHVLSSRGDSLETGIGWQQYNAEYSLRSSYRLPRRSKAREFWTADLLVGRENQDFEVKLNDDDPDTVDFSNGDVVGYSVKLGKLVVRDRALGYEQLFETWYAQYLHESRTFSASEFFIEGIPVTLSDQQLQPFEISDSSVSLGINWDWPVIRGSGFRTSGHHERAWIFTANKIWGTDPEFSQAYLSSNWARMLGPNWKLLLRGEIGYSDADIVTAQIDGPTYSVELAVTQLPNLYRFKAGGSRSVRGYGFESLSNNGVGSNNILTGSAEINWSFRKNWSAAAFFDVGNAFNEWHDANLKKGAGVGLRWYSIAGPLSLDVAQALSYDGHPWSINFTIGTPLL